MPFQKSPENPILTLGEPPEWDSHNLFSPMVVKHAGRYWMYYSGGPNGPMNDQPYTEYQLGLATSQDGIHFEKHTSTPLLPLGARDDFHTTPSVLRNADGTICGDAGYFQMWFTGNRGNDLEYATSVDGVHWDKHPRNPVFGGAYAPTVVRIGEDYRMWYTMGDYGSFRIGMAASEDGIHWRACPANPVMEPCLDWEMDNVFYPSVSREKGGYRLLYTVMGGRPHQCNLACTRSADGLHWPVAQRHLILSHGRPGEWDGVYASCPCLVPEPEGRDKLYYAGRIDMVHKYFAIGLATR